MVKVNEKTKDEEKGREGTIRDILDSHGFRMSNSIPSFLGDRYYKITSRKGMLFIKTVYGKIKRMEEDPIIVEIDEKYEAVLESLKNALTVIEDELGVECVLRVE